jgi:hypothetical protein
MVIGFWLEFVLSICFSLFPTYTAATGKNTSLPYPLPDYRSNPRLTVRADPNRFPIVFVYTVVESHCIYGFPGYIKTSLEQAIFSQPDCQVILLSNIKTCPQILQSVEDVLGLDIIDVTMFTSQRTETFTVLTKELFPDTISPVWVTSAVRFFMLEDFMINYGYRELLHVEADNMLYGRFTTLLPSIRKTYQMGVTPQNYQLTFVTASILWIGNLTALVEFNNFLLELGYNFNGMRDKYISYLKPSSWRKGGAFQDEKGIGIKLYAINEMSMLAFYHQLNPQVLK